jgi:hypothetical protein
MPKNAAWPKENCPAYPPSRFQATPRKAKKSMSTRRCTT